MPTATEEKTKTIEYLEYFGGTSRDILSGLREAIHRGVPIALKVHHPNMELMGRVAERPSEGVLTLEGPIMLYPSTKRMGERTNVELNEIHGMYIVRTREVPADSKKY